MLFRLRNQGNRPDAYEVWGVQVSGSAWKVEICVVQCYGYGPLYTPTIRVGQEFRFSLRTYIPADAQQGESIALTIMARSRTQTQILHTWDVVVRVGE